MTLPLHCPAVRRDDSLGPTPPVTATDLTPLPTPRPHLPAPRLETESCDSTVTRPDTPTDSRGPSPKPAACAAQPATAAAGHRGPQVVSPVTGRSCAPRDTLPPRPPHPAPPQARTPLTVIVEGHALPVSITPPLSPQWSCMGGGREWKHNSVGQHSGKW